MTAAVLLTLVLAWMAYDIYKLQVQVGQLQKAVKLLLPVLKEMLEQEEKK